MISKPLFRVGDRFTVARYINNSNNRSLSCPEGEMDATVDMQCMRNERYTIRNVCLYLDGLYEDNFFYYQFGDLNVAWTDEMSKEGLRLFRYLKPLTEAEFALTLAQDFVRRRMARRG